jgi:hypothetical protein
MIRTRGAPLILGLTLIAAIARADGLWREDEPRGKHITEPYRQKLRGVLLSKERAPLCQLMTIPSSGPEGAVYMVKKSAREVIVTSRTVKQPVWGQMMKALRPTGTGSWRIDTKAMGTTLEKMQVEVTVHEAALDADAARYVSELCREVLLQAQRSPGGQGGLDGVSYHATHWLPGGTLAGQTWSPAKGTIAAEFIAIEETLRSFAEASESARPKLKSELVERSRGLTERLRVAHDRSAGLQRQ